MSSADRLIALGLNKNEAKALDALISLGPSGASDVHKYAGMPRNKAYESLEKLAQKGMIEIQQSRPTLYRAIGAKAVIDHLVEEYSKGASEALVFFEQKQEEQKEEADNTSAWMVRGEMGVKRRLAELIYGAKKDIFGLGGYPPKYPLAVKSALKAASRRGVTVRIVCMMRPFDDVELSADDRVVVEFRTVRLTPKFLEKIDPYDQRLIESYRSISGFGEMVIVDEETAFDIVDDGKNPRDVSAIVLKAPGVPRIQKASAERMLGLFTRKI